MQSKEKIALFDFCETIANFQTADAFIEYVRIKSRSRRMHFLNQLYSLCRFIRLIPILERFLPIVSLNKKILTYQLRGFSSLQIDEYANMYYLEVVRPNLIKETIDRLITLISEGYEVIILSAGFDVYLKYFCLEYEIPLDNLICTKIQFCNNCCTGSFDGEDCINEFKIKYLEKRINKESCYSIAFSDSPSDLPMLKWADKGFIVLKSGRKNWGVNYNFETIIWT